MTARSPIDKTAAGRFHRYASVLHGLDRHPVGVEREFSVRFRSQRKLAVRRFPQPARGRGAAASSRPGCSTSPGLTLLLIVLSVSLVRDRIQEALDPSQARER